MVAAIEWRISGWEFNTLSWDDGVGGNQNLKRWLKVWKRMSATDAYTMVTLAWIDFPEESSTFFF